MSYAATNRRGRNRTCPSRVIGEVTIVYATGRKLLITADAASLPSRLARRAASSIRKTGQGTTENGVGESNPAAEAASTEKLYPFPSPLTEVMAGGTDGYG